MPRRSRFRAVLAIWLGLFVVTICSFVVSVACADGDSERTQKNSPIDALVTQYCADCHSKELKKGDLDLEALCVTGIESNPEAWEKVARKLRARQMPPPAKNRPDEATYQNVLAGLDVTLDSFWAKHPNPGRTETLRRLNRTEYQNAIRDLLDLEIDAATLLPKEDSGHGFDNVSVGNLSPTLLDRYITAAQKISRLALGTPGRSGGETFRIQPDITQEEHVEGLPPGTRGGMALAHTFPQDAEYEIQIRLTRDRNEEIEGLHAPHELEVLLDRERIKTFTVAPPSDKNYDAIDNKLKVRFPVTAGPHQLGVTFVKEPSELMETKRQPYNAHFNMHRHPRLTPAIYQISINGPYDSKGPGDTPSRRRIFSYQPSKAEEQDKTAERDLSALMRRAYRRPITEADLEKPMEFYHQGKGEGDFDRGLEAALSAILVSPEFLFRVEQEPPDVASHTPYRISDLELASRLSFFLWSSIPDDELLETAIRGKLHQPKVLDAQVRRMLADRRSDNLANNFAEQWLYLRNLGSLTPDLRLFPDFDDNLRQAFRKETELLFQDMVLQDRNVLDLLDADYTFLNERLAKHYGIPNIYGTRFRRVPLSHDEQRGGLLRQGSILTVTSYATRTSPVIRGKWVLENILGTPPPPPLPNVPALKDNTLSATLSVRERLAEHRANAACASCHNLMDPIGFSLENYDAIGRWRTVEEGQPIDVAGGLPDGSKFAGVEGLEENLRKRPDLFVGTLTEKLMTFALGRGMEPYDAPAVRKIVRDAQRDHFRFSSIILGIVNSTPFTMRRSL
jgi:mono/diheme cytochrome c family protein